MASKMPSIDFLMDRNDVVLASVLLKISCLSLIHTIRVCLDAICGADLFKPLFPSPLKTEYFSIDVSLLISGFIKFKIWTC